MAKPKWLSFGSVTSGTADGQFDMIVGARTGRLQRSLLAALYADEKSGVVTVKGNSGNKIITVDQYGVDVFDCTTASIALTSSAASLTNPIEGEANANKLTFMVYDYVTSTWKTDSGRMGLGTDNVTEYQGEDSPTVTVAGSWTGAKTTPLSGDITATNGNLIENDPGSVSKYTFKINVAVSENKTLLAGATKIGIFEGTSTIPTVEIPVTIVAGTSFLEVYEDADHQVPYTSHIFAAAGETDTVYVDTNDTWSVE